MYYYTQGRMQGNYKIFVILDIHAVVRGVWGLPPKKIFKNGAIS